MNHRHFLTLAPLTLALALTGCGGGSSGSTTPAPPTTSSPVTHVIGGIVSGLPSGTSLALQDNDRDTLTISGSGYDQIFIFPTALASGTPYSVTVSSQPSGVRCSVANGSGTMANSHITSVVVQCLNQLTTLYSFGAAPDGKSPVAGLIQDASGNLFGTTLYGGTNNLGSIFKLYADDHQASGYAESVLYSFSGTDGQGPQADLVMDASGNLYGTTANGGFIGASGNGGGTANGTVFRITPNSAQPPAYTQSVLYSFTDLDGAHPYAGLILDASGNLYGTTTNGGTNNQGTVFKISANGTESVLHSFGDSTDGRVPIASVIIDANGNLYGTTNLGGDYGYGTVFKLSPDNTQPSGYAESVLYSFGGNGADGQYPQAKLIMDANGNLYGTTYLGGTNSNGTVFKLSPNNTQISGYTETVVHSFGGGKDGTFPYAGLVMDANGNLYGTTYSGGSNNQGTLFEITANGTETVLHSFNTSDGKNPQAGLIINATGILYGTTPSGGAYGNGTVFRFIP